MKPLTAEWVEKAEGDFLVASQIMKRSQHRVLDAACFHCQQAVEDGQPAGDKALPSTHGPQPLAYCAGETAR